MDRFEYTTPTMGTTLKLVVYADAQSLAQKYINACLDEIERLIPVFNNYSPQSEISKLNSQSGKPNEVSVDLFRVLLKSKHWYELSGGAFDITSGALFELWKSVRRTRQLPTRIQRQQALELSGWHHVQCDASESKGQASEKYFVTVNQPGLVLDLSGIATGYIIDSAADVLVNTGCSRYLIDIGGDIRFGQAPPDKQGWTIQIAGLEKDSPPLMQVSLSNCALTTSGDRNQSVSIDGVSYSHLVDPKTGLPLTYHQSCTAIADKTIDADAAATTLSVLGRLKASGVFESLPVRQAILLFLEASMDPLQSPNPIFLRLGK